MSRARKSAKFLTLLAMIACGVFVFIKWRSPVDVTPNEEPITGIAIYVSPSGSEKGDGSKAAPLASVQQALTMLPEEGGTIVLDEGIYTESFTIEGEGNAPIVIRSAPGAHVVFEGGQKVTAWQPHPERKNVYIAQVSNRQGLFDADYLDFWDEAQRLRYGKMADAVSVEHWPGTVTLLEGNRVLFHPVGASSPDQLDLWANRRAEGVIIKRSNVTLKRLHFRNYLGGSYARAVSITAGENALIQDCTFTNCIAGVRSAADALTVVDCQFREVGCGVVQTTKGRDLTVRGSVFECAVGQFAFSDVGEHSRNGIRIYHKADGAVIEGCVTSGFWAGLYIKTISGEPESRPYTIRNNTFLDGIRSGYDHRQPRTTISHNIIGTPSSTEAAGVKASYFVNMGASLSNNLFFGDDAPETRDPFVNIAAGDLTLHPGTDPQVGAASRRKVKWTDGTSRHLARRAATGVPSSLIGEPVVVASQLGALVNTHFSGPVKATLRYRATNTGEWQTASGGETTITLPRNMIAFTPFEPWEPEVYSWSFFCNRLSAGQTYEYQIDVTDPKDDRLPTVSGSFQAIGAPKQLHVNAGAQTKSADGSPGRPFADLQPALDRALPGDTILVGPGLYSRPAILRHGGLDNAPIRIVGAGWNDTIWDGGKRVGTLLELQSAPYVTIQGIQFRWFGNYGVTAKNSPGVELIKCWVWNHSFTDNGHCGIGVLFERSPKGTIKESLFNRLQNAVIFSHSPGAVFTHNTAMGNLYSGLDLRHSALGSTVTHNSLTFTGNRALFIEEQDRSAFDSLHCDFNNFGNVLRSTSPKTAEKGFQPAKRYSTLVNKSKGIVAVTMGKDVWRDFHSMADWRAFSSKDANSLYADPQYVDPLRKDLHLLPASPNILSHGAVVGALLVVPQRATPGRSK